MLYVYLTNKQFVKTIYSMVRSNKKILKAKNNSIFVRNLSWNVIFYGNNTFSLETLKLLNENRIGVKNGLEVVKNLEVVCSSKNNPLKMYAVDSEIIVHDWPHVLSQNTFDVGVIVCFEHAIPVTCISACKYGMITIHPSLLPRWRGTEPIVHTILNGDKITGVTVLQVPLEKSDNGNILLQEQLDVPPQSTSSSLFSYLAPKAAKMVLHCLENLPNLIKQSKPQSETGITHAFEISQSMGYIDWDNKMCQEIDRQYRALNKMVKLYTDCEQGIQIMLLDMVEPKNMTLQADIETDVRPGFSYFNKNLKALCIRCKDGWVGFRRVILPENQILKALEFSNGYLSKLPNDERYLRKVRIYKHHR